MNYRNVLILILSRVSLKALGKEFRTHFQSICTTPESATPEVPPREGASKIFFGSKKQESSRSENVERGRRIEK